MLWEGITKLTSERSQRGKTLNETIMKGWPKVRHSRQQETMEVTDINVQQRMAWLFIDIKLLYSSDFTRDCYREAIWESYVKEINPEASQMWTSCLCYLRYNLQPHDSLSDTTETIKWSEMGQTPGYSSAGFWSFAAIRIWIWTAWLRPAIPVDVTDSHVAKNKWSLFLILALCTLKCGHQSIFVRHGIPDKDPDF